MRSQIRFRANLGIGNGVGKQGRGNQPPIDDTDPIRKFSIDPRGPHGLAKTSRILSKKEFQYGISVSTPHRRYGHPLRTPFLRTPFPRLLAKIRAKIPCKKPTQKIRAKICAKLAPKRRAKSQCKIRANCFLMVTPQTAKRPKF